MIALNRIYTRTGDDGTTGLVGKERRSKSDPRIAAIGDVDELNAAIGLARAVSRGDRAIDPVLARIQNDLFDLGADLATVTDDEGALRVTEAQVEKLEAEIDRWNADLKPLTSFVLPGGSEFASALHFARTVARRAERSCVRLTEQTGESVNDSALHFLNRLSDFLFVAARWANDRGAEDVLWVPGKNR